MLSDLWLLRRELETKRWAKDTASENKRRNREDPFLKPVKYARHGQKMSKFKMPEWNKERTMKIKVPEGMLEAAFAALSEDERQGKPPSYGAFLEAALHWLSEHPIVPTQAQLEYLTGSWREAGTPMCSTEWIAIEWQRRMFLNLEPEDPEEIKDLLDQYCSESYRGDLLEAYRRGQRSKESK